MSYIDDILGVIPEPLRQVGAGIATIPSEAGRFAAMLANPARTIRQFRGTTTPEDNEGVAASIQGVSNRWNAGVNDALNIRDPSVLDNTGSALARFAGGALPQLPVRAISAAPLAVRSLARLAEVMTPVTATSKTGLGRMAPTVANTVVPAVAAGAVEKLTEDHDPTQVERIYDADGKLEETIYPAEEAGAGRRAANMVTTAVGNHPGLAAAGGAGALLLGLAARRANRAAATVRQAEEGSTVIRPRDPTITPEAEVPGVGVVDKAMEVAADQNLTTKEAVRQALPQNVKRAEDINSFVDLMTEQSHKSRVQALREQGIIETPKGVNRTESLNRLAEELTLASRERPDLKRMVDERIELENALDERIAHENVVNNLRNKVDANGKPLHDTDEKLAAASDGSYVRVDSNRPKLDAQGNQIVLDNKPQWEPDYVIARPSQWNQSNDDIRNLLRPLRNPDTDAWYNRYRKIHDDVLRSVVDYDALGPDEMAKMIGKPGQTTGMNPHYRHTTNLDEPKSPFTFRLRGHKEGPEFGGDPWNAAREYLDHAVDYSYRNMVKREVMDSLIDAHEAGLDIGKLVIKHNDMRHLSKKIVASSPVGVAPRSMNKSDVKMDGDVVRYRRGNEQIEVQVGNKSLYHSMVAMPRHTQTVMGTIRGWAESGMTGKIATLLGQPFALANATMGAMFAMVTRPKNLPLGVLDRATMAATGGRFGVRGDPTAYVGMTAQMVKNVAAVSARAMSDSIRNSIAMGGTLSKVLPNPDAIADRLGKAFADSMYGRQMRAGAGDVNLLGGQGVDTTPKSSMIAGMEHTEQARVVAPTNPGDFKRYLDIYGKNAVPASAKSAWRLLGELQQAVSNAPQSYAFATNVSRRTKGMTDAQAFREVQNLSAQVRQLLGDPAMRGTGLRDFDKVSGLSAKGAVGRVLDASPYGNISVQALARITRAFKENPVGTTAGLALTVAPMTILPLIRAYDLDKERKAQGLPPIYLRYELSREAYTVGRMVEVHIQGVPPDASPRFRVDPVIAGAVAMAREAVLYALGVSANREYEPIGNLDVSMEALREYAQGRAAHNVGINALNMLPISQLPPVITAGAAAFGVEMPQVADMLGRSGGGARMINEQGLGGYDQTTLQGASVSKRLGAVLQALLPGSMGSFLAYLSAGEQAERKAPGTGVGAALGEAVGRSRDRLGELNGVLWEPQARRHATSDYTAEAVNAREATFQRVEQNWRAVKYPGTIGSGDYRRQMPEGEGVQGVSDPAMVDLLSLVHRAWGRLEKYTGERKEAREALLNVRQRGITDFVERRRLENEQADRIREINGRLLAGYIRLEEELSRHTGYRVRLDTLDPTKPITQFPRLQ